MPGREDSPRIDRFVNEIGGIFRSGGSSRFTIDTTAFEDPNARLPGVEPTEGVVRLEDGNDTIRTLGTVGEHDQLSFNLNRQRAIVSVGGDDIARVFNPTADPAPDAGPEPLAAAPAVTTDDRDELTPSGEPADDTVDLDTTSTGTGAGNSSTGPGTTSSMTGGEIGAGALAVVVGLIVSAAVAFGGD